MARDTDSPTEFASPAPGNERGVMDDGHRYYFAKENSSRFTHRYVPITSFQKAIPHFGIPVAQCPRFATRPASAALMTPARRPARVRNEAATAASPKISSPKNGVDISTPRTPATPSGSSTDVLAQMSDNDSFSSEEDDASTASSRPRSSSFFGVVDEFYDGAIQVQAMELRLFRGSSCSTSIVALLLTTVPLACVAEIERQTCLERQGLGQNSSWCSPREQGPPFRLESWQGMFVVCDVCCTLFPSKLLNSCCAPQRFRKQLRQKLLQFEAKQNNKTRELPEVLVRLWRLIEPFCATTASIFVSPGDRRK